MLCSLKENHRRAKQLLCSLVKCFILEPSSLNSILYRSVISWLAYKAFNYENFHFSICQTIILIRTSYKLSLNSFFFLEYISNHIFAILFKSLSHKKYNNTFIYIPFCSLCCLHPIWIQFLVLLNSPLVYIRVD